MTAPLSELSFALGETNFTISKLLAEEAFDTFEIVRVGLADVNRIPLSEDAHAVQAVTAVFSGFSRETFRTVRDRLFAEVQFTRPNIKTARKVHGNISTAFDGLEPFHIYEVFARALRRKFSQVLGRRPLNVGSFNGRSGEGISTRNVEPFFSVLFAARLISPDQLHERLPCGRPRLTLADLCNLHETLLVEAENQRRATSKAEQDAKIKNFSGSRTRVRRR